MSGRILAASVNWDTVSSFRGFYCGPLLASRKFGCRLITRATTGRFNWSALIFIHSTHCSLRPSATRCVTENHERKVLFKRSILSVLGFEKIFSGPRSPPALCCLTASTSTTLLLLHLEAEREDQLFLKCCLCLLICQNYLWNYELWVKSHLKTMLKHASTLCARGKLFTA